MSFPTTQWTQLALATLNGDTVGRAALDKFCQHYWQPVFLFIRFRWGIPEQARDLTQDFFLRVLEGADYKRADRLKGKFRTFLLGAVLHFLAEKARAAKAQKRGGDWDQTEMEDEKASVSPADELVFDREWALAVLERALAVVRAECVEARGAVAAEQLFLFLPGAAASPPSYDELAARLGMALSAVKTVIHRLRQRLREALRAEIARTVSAPHEIEEEFNHLRRVLDAA